MYRDIKAKFAEKKLPEVSFLQKKDGVPEKSLLKNNGKNFMKKQGVLKSIKKTKNSHLGRIATAF